MKHHLTALLALTLATPSVAQTTLAVRPTPVNPAMWITPDDYPSVAMRYGVFGNVAFALTVNGEGRATNCQIVKSSGFDVLDNATCAPLLRGVQFTPGKDNAGHPVESTYNGRIRWHLPAGLDQPSPDAVAGTTPVSVEYEMTVEPDGKISSCVPKGRVGEAKDEIFCQHNLTTQPILDNSGRPIRARIKVARSVQIEEIR